MNDPGRTALPSSRRWHDLGTRVASGLVLVAIALGTARVGGALFVVVWLLAALAVAWEWQRLIGAPAFASRVAVAAATLLFVAVRAQSDPIEAFLVILGAAGILALLAGEGHRIWGAGGMLYAGLLLLTTIALRFSFPFGMLSIVWLFATVWSTDTFAYFGGRLIGGPKLSPRISPSKTWAGTLVGLAAGSLIGTATAVSLLPAPSSILPISLVTLAASFSSQAGDAFESAVKRHFGAKDSSRLIPGHGGVMDRLDGFIAAAAFAFCVGIARNNLPSVAGGLFYWP